MGECEDGALDHVKGETMSEATVNSDLDPLLLLCLRIRLLSVLAPLPSLLTPPPPERVHLRVEAVKENDDLLLNPKLIK